MADDVAAEVARLKALNEELVEALAELHEVVDACCAGEFSEPCEIIDGLCDESLCENFGCVSDKLIRSGAVLAKARGEK